MRNTFQRRHSLWHERILFSGYFQFLLGVLFVTLLPLWQFVFFNHSGKLSDSLYINTLLSEVTCFCLAFIIIRQIRHFPGAQQSVVYILPLLAIIWLVIVSGMSYLRIEYIRQPLLISYIFANIWSVTAFYIRKRFRAPKLALVPLGRAESLSINPELQLHTLYAPDLQGRRYDAIVADLHFDQIPAVWEKFLAKCTLSNIPVFHYRQIEEMLTGRVSIGHMAENDIGTLTPSPMYSIMKRFFDAILVFILIPLILPVVIVTGLLIKLDSKGPVFFIQERIGYRGKLFNVYKFRSMHVDIEGEGYTNENNDPRITDIGRIIRKYRIDELPQLVNVLKGEMSFIGPRPESKELAEWYEDMIPFFSYRHVVRPGISGWAQVNQGYTADLKGMEKKLQYDFYYIKHFSIWLDVLIFFKTIRTVLTGFGAR
ncbi:exopolysaccharide biosynthesis polyprenyl glycosylphosphotransferase [Oceanospirillum sp.]|uniref:exopolysaccharide biosynthesis polyprenyl glycosylphosphotransferase n=1 Tax=Oceanospirillum sp. TaxID=2021254 RepID=UPI003A959602